jgi:ribonuclease-3
MMADWAALEKRLGYTFRDRELLRRALTHPSFAQTAATPTQHNQRLEFLGDAVLGMLLAEHLCALFPKEREGRLTQYRALLARGPMLARLARELGLAEAIRLSDGEIQNGGRERASILEDAFEALVGGIYLDSDYPTTRNAVLPWFRDIPAYLEETAAEQNPKGRLQEWLQPLHGNEAIAYEVLEATGPDHRRTFRVEVRVNGETWGTGTGLSKKEAEEAAAREALTREAADEVAGG